MLRKPGPATSTSDTPAVLVRRRASSSANARGLVPAFFASCIATLVAQSPCSRWRGRSRCTVAGIAAGSRANVPSSTACTRAALRASEKLGGSHRRRVPSRSGAVCSGLGRAWSAGRRTSAGHEQEGHQRRGARRTARVHEPVATCRTPMPTGPTTASPYPTPCTIPDSAHGDRGRPRPQADEREHAPGRRPGPMPTRTIHTAVPCAGASISPSVARPPSTRRSRRRAGTGCASGR